MVASAFTQLIGGRQAGHECVADTRANHTRKACKRTLTERSLLRPYRHQQGCLSGMVDIQDTQAGALHARDHSDKCSGQHSSRQSLSFTIVR